MTSSLNGVRITKILYLLDIALTAPKTAVKVLISLGTFSIGVVTIMQNDKLLKRKGIRTQFSKKIKEIWLTMTLTFYMLVVPLVHVSLMMLFSTITIFSWSWTNQEPKTYHYYFLLPFLPLSLAPLVQFILYWKYVKPETNRQQWYAFLSILIPVRVHLIKELDQAYKYFLASVMNICIVITCSWMLLLVAISNLPEAEDTSNGFLFFIAEVPMAVFLYLVLFLYVSSRMLWYLVIAPDFVTLHCMPDFESFDERLSTFPNYWNNKFQCLLVEELSHIRTEDEMNLLADGKIVSKENIASERTDMEEIQGRYK